MIKTSHGTVNWIMSCCGDIGGLSVFRWWEFYLPFHFFLFVDVFYILPCVRQNDLQTYCVFYYKKTKAQKTLFIACEIPCLGTLGKRKKNHSLSSLTLKMFPITIDFVCAVFAHRLSNIGLKQCASFWELAPSSLEFYFGEPDELET